MNIFKFRVGGPIEELFHLPFGGGVSCLNEFSMGFSLLPHSISGHVQYILQAYGENMIPKYEWYKKSRLKKDSGDNLLNGKWIHKEKKERGKFP